MHEHTHMEEEHICTLCSFNYSRWGKKRCPRSLCHRYELISVMGVQGELLKLLDQLRRWSPRVKQSAP